MTRNLCWLLGGVIVGFILASILQIVNSSNGDDFIDGEFQTERIIQAIKESVNHGESGLSDEVVKLQKMVESLNKREVIETSEPQGDSSIRGQSKKYPTGWISVLDKDLATILVEKGITPFDKGVSPIVSEANVALREAKKRIKEIEDKLQKQHPRWMMTSKGYNADNLSYHAAFDPLFKEYQQERAAVLKKVTDSIVALKRK